MALNGTHTRLRSNSSRAEFYALSGDEPQEEDGGDPSRAHVPYRGHRRWLSLGRLRATSRARLLVVLAGLTTVLFLLYMTVKDSISGPLISVSHLVPGSRGSSKPGSPSNTSFSKRPHTDDPRKAIVFASYLAQDVSWFPEIPKGWEVYRYILDDPNPDPSQGLPVPRDQGREAMAYLTFIIDHYDDLPDFVVFHHGHRRAWHQVESTPDKLRALNLTALSQENYINFRCALDPGCTDETYIDVANPPEGEERIQALMLPKFWNSMFGNETDWDLGPPPEALSIPCCAQFAVTRGAILARPWAFWQNYREPLEQDLEQYVELWGEDTNSYYVGICYEKLWHMVFGKPAQHCPSEAHCRGVQFSDAIVCNKYTGQYDKSEGWEQIECIQKWQDSW